MVSKGEPEFTWSVSRLPISKLSILTISQHSFLFIWKNQIPTYSNSIFFGIGSSNGEQWNGIVVQTITQTINSKVHALAVSILTPISNTILKSNYYSVNYFFFFYQREFKRCRWNDTRSWNFSSIYIILVSLIFQTKQILKKICNVMKRRNKQKRRAFQFYKACSSTS